MTAIGEFDTDSYTSQGSDGGLLWSFFIFTTFILSIVMLNMLIAMMGQSYEKVSEVAQASMLKERMLLIMENYFLIGANKFKQAKYLISFAPIQQTEEEEANQKLFAMMETIINSNKDLSDKID
jgi:hypothetical protein